MSNYEIGFDPGDEEEEEETSDYDDTIDDVLSESLPDGDEG